MNRRNALKIAAAVALSATVVGAYDEKLLVNTRDMKLIDPTKPNDHEYKHMPEIKVGAKDSKGFSLVEIEIGQEGIIHPSVANHWIYEIELLADGKSVSKVSLEPVTSRGFLAARVDMTNVKELSAVAKCNLHGNYTDSIKV